MNESSETYAYCALFLPFVRYLIRGPTPMHLISAPVAGTGKTLLADLISIICIGKTSIMTINDKQDDMQKRITTVLQESPSIVTFDNIVFLNKASSPMAAVITATEWTDRAMATHNLVKLPVKCTWMGTGNNVTISEEMSRRIIEIRLNANKEKPWLRRNYKIKNIKKWAFNNRDKLVSSCLTIIKYCLSLDYTIPEDFNKLGGFEEWSEIMYRITAGISLGGFLEDVLEDKTNIIGQDADSSIIELWLRNGSKDPDGNTLWMTTRQIADAVNFDDPGNSYTAHRIGGFLNKNKDTIRNGCQIQVRKKRFLEGRVLVSNDG